MIDTALDVARAMAHLHAHNILHSDLKARNVLLRSDMHDCRGFTAKVADFGLSLTIDPHSTHVSNAFQVCVGLDCCLVGWCY
jgi:serine/threonine protein kinase